MIYNTEIFEVSDINEFKRAFESLRGAMSEAGGTELRIYRCVDNPTKVSWPPHCHPSRSSAYSAAKATL